MAKGNFLTPRIQGDVLQAHPIIVLLTVMGGARPVGLLGMMLAVPTLAVLRIFFDFFRARIQTSPKSDPGSPDHL